MSVQSQIDRISGAVQSALAALAEKGVTVPAGTKVDGLADLIAAIEAGGGGGTINGFPFDAGSFTLAENTSSVYTISENAEEVLPSLKASGLPYYYFDSKSVFLLWASPLPTSDSINDHPNMLFFSVSANPTVSTASTKPMWLAYISSSGNVEVKKCSSDVKEGLYVYNKKLFAGFRSSSIGYAGVQYNWLAIRRV